MDFNMGNTFDSFKDGTKEIAEITHQKTKELHEKYVSKILPDCGKYGDAAKFIAEMAPGVAEYNAIREGDWKEFAIAAGLDITAVGIGVTTADAGYAAIKGGSAAAKTGTKLAVKEIAEAGTKKIMKKTAGEATEKIVKETVGTAAEKIAKEVTETGVEKVAKETVAMTTEKVVKEGIESSTEKIIKENMKESVDTGIRVSEKNFSELYTTSEERIRFAKNSDGNWSKEIGNSEFIPHKKEAQEALAKYNQRRIEYIDGNPNFEKVSECIVKIDNMTSVRTSNFRQADIRCANKWNVEQKAGKSNWTYRDVCQWRSENRYSWHERIDRETMDLIPREIHEECKHFGGIAECKRAERIDGIGDGFDE